MGLITYFVATSSDGYIAEADGGVDWCFQDADYGYAAFYETVEAIVMGRRAYDKALSFGEWPFAEKTTYVFTNSTLDAPPPGVTAVRADAASFSDTLTARHSGTIWLFGGANLAEQFRAAGLIDEYVLSIHPIVLGSGIPLFASGSTPTRLQLVGVTEFDSGLVQLHYRAATNMPTDNMPAESG